MHLVLNDEEVTILRELLQRAFAELREEAHKTEAADWKRALKRSESVLRTLIEKTR
jgi:hypothetical protein